MREHRGRTNAENKAAELINKPKRSAAEQADFDIIKRALDGSEG